MRLKDIFDRVGQNKAYWDISLSILFAQKPAYFWKFWPTMSTIVDNELFSWNVRTKKKRKIEHRAHLVNLLILDFSLDHFPRLLTTGDFEVCCMYYNEYNEKLYKEELTPGFRNSFSKLIDYRHNIEKFGYLRYLLPVYATSTSWCD